MFDSVQTTLDLADKLYFYLFKEGAHEYCDRTLTGPCDRHINFADTEVFKLFRGRVFDRRGYLGSNASESKLSSDPKRQCLAVLERFSI